MKIAFILPVNMKRFGYTKDNFLKSHFSVDMARAVAKQGHEVSLHTFWDRRYSIKNKDMSVNFYPTSFNRILNADFSEISISLLNEKFSDDTIINFHEPNSLFFNLFILNHHNKIVVKHHGNGIVNPMPFPSVLWFLYGIIRRFFLSSALKKCEACILLNNLAVNNFRTYGVDENKIYKINNGINTDKFKIFDRKSYRRKFGFNDSDIVYLFVGRISKDKGIRELVSAFNSLKSVNKKTKLVIIGPLQDKNLKDLIQPYWQGFKNPQELQKWLSLTDVFVAPSYAEPYGNVLTEALYYNLPIITTNAGGPPEFVPVANAIFIPPKDVKSLEKAMIKMYDPDFRLNKSFGGRKMVEQKFTWNKICRKYIQIYKKIKFN